MRTTGAPFLLAVLLALGSGAPVIQASGKGTGTREDAPSRPAPAPVRLPVVFEENRGQAPRGCGFVARAPLCTALLTQDGAVFVPAGARGLRAAAPVRMSVRGASPAARTVAADPLPGRSHYLRGRDPLRWIRGVPHFGGVRTEGLLPGVELRWRGDAGRLEWDLLLAAGVDPASVVLEFRGVRGIRADPSGGLEMETACGVLRHGSPRLWQESGGRRRPVRGGFVLLGGGSVGLAAEGRDPARPLVFDPRVEYCTFLGGSDSDEIAGVAADAEGAFYATGSTYSTDFPLQDPMPSPAPGSLDCFVTKIDGTGSAIVWSTYVGGEESSDWGNAIAVGADGRPVVTGASYSDDFPTVSAYQDTPAGNLEAIAFRLAADGSGFVFSTYLGGGASDEGLAAAVDPEGAALVGGDAGSSNFPSLGGPSGIHVGGGAAFVAKFASSDGSLQWCFRIGGSKSEKAAGISTDADGAVVVAGRTESGDYPMVAALQAAYGGGNTDAFVAKFPADASSVIFSTCLGGLSDDEATGAAFAPDGTVVVTGLTKSTGFPLKDALQPSYGSQQDGFVAKIAADGSALRWSTYLGGFQADLPHAVAVSPAGVVFVAGETVSTDFPLVNAIQATHAGGFRDGFLAAIEPDGKFLLLSTYRGGSGTDILQSVAVAGTGRVCCGGWSWTSDYPLRNPFDSTMAGGVEGVLTFLRTTPATPADLEAAAASSARVDVSWTDASDDELGFELQRRIGENPWATIASPEAGSNSRTDGNVFGSATFEYRLRAVNDYGASPWTASAFATTPPGPPGPPAAPSALTATLGVDGRSAQLAWTDGSDTEEFFLVFRRTGQGAYATRASTGPDNPAYGDTGLLPDRVYAWMVRAGTSGGTSAPTNEASVLTPPTVEFTLVKGKLKATGKPGKGSIKVALAAALGAGAQAPSLDPVAAGLVLRPGDRDVPPLLVIPPVDAGWRPRKGKFTWKSPKEALTKGKVVFVPETGALTIAISRLTLTAPAMPLRLSLDVGAEAGSHEDAWTEGKPGVFRFP